MSDKDIVAIIGGHEDAMWVWTVFVGPNSNLGFSRLTGAWETSRSDLSKLHFWPNVVGVLCPSSLWERVKTDLELDLRRIDADDLVSSIEEEINQLQDLYSTTQAQLQSEKKTAKLVAPRWPKLYKLPVRAFRLSAETVTQQEVLEAAWWLKALCETWSEIEEIRLARIYMRDSVGSEIRNQPWVDEQTQPTLF